MEVPDRLRAGALSLSLEPRGDALHLRARAERLELAGLALDAPALDCPLAGTRLECRAGQAAFTLPDGSRVAARVSLKHGAAGLTLDARSPRVGTGAWRLSLAATADGGWRAHIEAEGIDLARLPANVPVAWIEAIPAGRWPASLAGHATLSGSASGNAAGLSSLELHAAIEGLAFSATDAAEQAALTLALKATRARTGWRYLVEGRQEAGVLYLVPGFTVGGGLPGLLLDTAAAGTVALRASGEWAPQEARVALDELSLVQGQDLRLTARALLADGRARELTLELPATPLQRLYRTWLQPFLAGTLLDSLDGEGAVGLALQMKGARTDLALDFSGLSVTDTRGRFSVHGLDGRIALGPAHAGQTSQLSLAGLSVHGLPLGPARLPLRALADGLQLEEATELPLLDGRFLLEGMSLSMGGDDGAGSELRLSGVLTPVSLPALCEALGLPRAAGQLSGVVPEVRWSADRIRFDGDLLLRLFDGRIVARDLVVLDPFGTLPGLATDLDVERIDLDLLTRESGFGRIRGRIGGHVKGLRLQGWQPVAMDLYLATPENDDRPHRISQRAVGSLSALSGGGTGPLSGGLMRIFREYSYGRLGVGCRLVDGVCEVRGVERSDDGGVVLVSRGGLLPPWIEVRASGRALAWKSLMEIYRRIEGGEPVVQ